VAWYGSERVKGLKFKNWIHHYSCRIEGPKFIYIISYIINTACANRLYDSAALIIILLLYVFTFINRAANSYFTWDVLGWLRTGSRQIWRGHDVTYRGVWFAMKTSVRRAGC
jgi:hypothetical protein